jgi:hypothetical protein
MTRSRALYGYRLRVEGHLDDHWSATFDSLALTRENDGTTSLSGPVTDQAALHGLLTKIRDLGILLISVEPIEATAQSSCVGDGVTWGEASSQAPVDLDH